MRLSSPSAKYIAQLPPGQRPGGFILCDQGICSEAYYVRSAHTGHSLPHRLYVGGEIVGIYLIRPKTLCSIGLYLLLGTLALTGPMLGSRGESATLGSLPFLFHTVGIDPGHGGVDPGAVATGRITEKEIDLAVSERLAQLLQQAGARVVMTRWTDRDLGSSNRLRERKREDFAARRELIAASGAEVLISVHANSFPMASCQGPQVFYDADCEDSQRLAITLQTTFNATIAGSRRLSKPLDHYIIQTAKIPAVTIELGFMSNGTELRRLMTGAYRDQLAFAIYTGLLKFMSEGDYTSLS